jgi:hypothetical protein
VAYLPTYLPTYLIVPVHLSRFSPLKTRRNQMHRGERGERKVLVQALPTTLYLSNSNNDNDNDNDGDDDKATHSTRPGLVWSGLIHFQSVPVNG